MQRHAASCNSFGEEAGGRRRRACGTVYIRMPGGKGGKPRTAGRVVDLRASRHHAALADYRWSGDGRSGI